MGKRIWKKNRYIYTYNWLTWCISETNTVHQLYSNKKLNVKKEGVTVIPDSTVSKPAGRMAWQTIPHLIRLTKATSLVQTRSAQTRWWRARPPEAGTRRRAVVVSSALTHPAAGLGRTTARNLVVGARTRACPNDPWSPSESKARPSTVKFNTHTSWARTLQIISLLLTYWEKKKMLPVDMPLCAQRTRHSRQRKTRKKVRS